MEMATEHGEFNTKNYHIHWHEYHTHRTYITVFVVVAIQSEKLKLMKKQQKEVITKTHANATQYISLFRFCVGRETKAEKKRSTQNIYMGNILDGFYFIFQSILILHLMAWYNLINIYHPKFKKKKRTYKMVLLNSIFQ